MFKLNETFPALLKDSYQVDVYKKLTSVPPDKTIELLSASGNEHAVTWNDTVVAILGDIEVAETVFHQYCMKAMSLYPHSSFNIIDFTQ